MGLVLAMTLSHDGYMPLDPHEVGVLKASIAVAGSLARSNRQGGRGRKILRDGKMRSPTAS